VRRAARRGLAERIAAAACEPDRLGLDEWRGKVDLVVLMHVLHEVPDQIGLLEQARDLLKPGGKLLLCEPPHRYVGERSYQWELARCRAVGFEEEEIPGRARPRRALFAWRPPR